MFFPTLQHPLEVKHPVEWHIYLASKAINFIFHTTIDICHHRYVALPGLVTTVTDLLLDLGV